MCFARTPSAYRLPILLLACAAWPASVVHAQEAARVVLMEPAGASTYHPVSDPEKLRTYNTWLANDSARRALALYTRAHALAAPRAAAAEGPAQPSQSAVPPPTLPPYYIALVPGGNNPATGFRLETDSGVEGHLHTIYIQLDPSPDSLATTLLHETGHIVLAVLNGGDGVPRDELAPIPHSTAALTDRGTAFDEGFAIHLETFAAHRTHDAELRARYHHEAFRFGPTHPKQGSEYSRHAVDLQTYSQTTARYHEVRENNYAFAPACREPDYLRVQLDKSRDFATLRDADQLLQCEGFYASFFFALTFRGEALPDEATLLARQERMLTAIRDVLAGQLDASTPYLLRFVEAYMRLYPDEAGEIVDVLLDLSHGVFVDADAAALWREYYEAALRLDFPALPKDRIQAARERWRAAVLNDPQVLYGRLGPQLPCTVAARTVKLVALNNERKLAFDVNTVEEGVLKLIPEITPDEVSRWLAARAKKPFQSGEDFKQRAALREAVLGQLQLSPPVALLPWIVPPAAGAGVFVGWRWLKRNPAAAAPAAHAPLVQA